MSEKLKAFGIQDHQIKKLLKAHTSQYLLANIAVVEEKLKKGDVIKNVPAYLMKAFEVDFTPKETEHDKLMRQKAVEAKLKAEKAEQSKLEMDALYGSYKEEVDAQLTRLKDEFQQEEVGQHKLEFEAEILNTEFLCKAYQSK